MNDMSLESPTAQQPSIPEPPPSGSTVGPRLQPEDRRRHLLDTARSIVQEQGLAALSMDGVATQAGVSRALVYTYFNSRSGLIHSLWEEVASLWDVAPMPPFEEMLESGTLRELFDQRLEENTRWYFDQIEHSGLLFHRLMSEPVLEDSVEKARKQIQANNIAWWSRLVEAMGVDAERAVVFSSLINSVNTTLWSLFVRGDAPREVIEDIFFLTCRTTLDALLAAPSSTSSDSQGVPPC